MCASDRARVTQTERKKWLSSSLLTSRTEKPLAPPPSRGWTRTCHRSTGWRRQTSPPCTHGPDGRLSTTARAARHMFCFVLQKSNLPGSHSLIWHKTVVILRCCCPNSTNLVRIQLGWTWWGGCSSPWRTQNLPHPMELTNKSGATHVSSQIEW